MRAQTIIKIIWSLCFLIGASTHAMDIWRGGWLPYGFMPLPFNAYWTALLPLDLMAAVLIWVRVRLGILLAIAIMVSDVLVNSYVAFFVFEEWPLIPLVMQTVFLLFVLATAPRLWQSYR